MNPVFTVRVHNATTNSLNVQIYYGETSDAAMCGNIEKILFSSVQTQSGCESYKLCEKVWELNGKKLCEYQCSCPESCKLNIVTLESEDVEWKICDIRV